MKQETLCVFTNHVSNQKLLILVSSILRVTFFSISCQFLNMQIILPGRTHSKSIVMDDNIEERRVMG